MITDVQRFSLHDGPGIRTTVFFKGCPLRCEWCHNPECISLETETLCYPEKCIGCGTCDSGCFSGAKVPCGKEYTAEELMKEILADRAYYGIDGGVTFSGGEPLLQRDFLMPLLKHCKEAGIHTAVETSLFIMDEEVFKAVDLVMADLKIWDSEIHKEYTGTENEKIKENFIFLNTLKVPVIARTPVIPEIWQDIPSISAFLRTLENIKQYELLPYHPLGVSKAKALGRNQTSFTVPTEDTMKELNQYAFLR